MPDEQEEEVFQREKMLEVEFITISNLFTKAHAGFDKTNMPSKLMVEKLKTDL